MPVVAKKRDRLFATFIKWITFTLVYYLFALPLLYHLWVPNTQEFYHFLTDNLPDLPTTLLGQESEGHNSRGHEIYDHEMAAFSAQPIYSSDDLIDITKSRPLNDFQGLHDLNDLHSLKVFCLGKTITHLPLDSLRIRLPTTSNLDRERSSLWSRASDVCLSSTNAFKTDLPNSDTPSISDLNPHLRPHFTGAASNTNRRRLVATAQHEGTTIPTTIGPDLLTEDDVLYWKALSIILPHNLTNFETTKIGIVSAFERTIFWLSFLLFLLHAFQLKNRLFRPTRRNPIVATPLNGAESASSIKSPPQAETKSVGLDSLMLSTLCLLSLTHILLLLDFGASGFKVPFSPLSVYPDLTFSTLTQSYVHAITHQLTHPHIMSHTRMPTGIRPFSNDIFLLDGFLSFSGFSGFISSLPSSVSFLDFLRRSLGNLSFAIGIPSVTTSHKSAADEAGFPRPPSAYVLLFAIFGILLDLTACVCLYRQLIRCLGLPKLRMGYRPLPSEPTSDGTPGVRPTSLKIYKRIIGILFVYGACSLSAGYTFIKNYPSCTMNDALKPHEPIDHAPPDYLHFTRAFFSSKDQALISVDILLPKQVVRTTLGVMDVVANGVLPNHVPPPLGKRKKFPTFFIGTRYNRRMSLRWPISAFRVWQQNRRSSSAVWTWPLTRVLLQKKVPVVVMDVRGSGASEGRRAIDLDTVEIEDVTAVMRWAKAQFWSDGTLAAGGLSYDALIALKTLAATVRKPANTDNGPVTTNQSDRSPTIRGLNEVNEEEISGGESSEGEVSEGVISESENRDSDTTGRHSRLIDKMVALHAPLRPVVDLIHNEGMPCPAFVNDYDSMTRAFEQDGNPLFHFLESAASYVPLQITLGFLFAFRAPLAPSGFEEYVSPPSSSPSLSGLPLQRPRRLFPSLLRTRLENWSMKRETDHRYFLEERLTLLDGRTVRAAEGGLSAEDLVNIASEARIPIFAAVAMCDGSSVKRTLEWFKTLTPPSPSSSSPSSARTLAKSQLIVGPWGHGGRRGCGGSVPGSNGSWSCAETQVYSRVADFVLGSPKSEPLVSLTAAIESSKSQLGKNDQSSLESQADAAVSIYLDQNYLPVDSKTVPLLDSHEHGLEVRLVEDTKGLPLAETLSPLRLLFFHPLLAWDLGQHWKTGDVPGLVHDVLDLAVVVGTRLNFILRSLSFKCGSLVYCYDWRHSTGVLSRWSIVQHLLRIATDDQFPGKFQRLLQKRGNQSAIPPLSLVSATPSTPTTFLNISRGQDLRPVPVFGTARLRLSLFVKDDRTWQTLLEEKANGAVFDLPLIASLSLVESTANSEEDNVAAPVTSVTTLTEGRALSSLRSVCANGSQPSFALQDKNMMSFDDQRFPSDSWKLPGSKSAPVNSKVCEGERLEANGEFDLQLEFEGASFKFRPESDRLIVNLWPEDLDNFPWSRIEQKFREDHFRSPRETLRRLEIGKHLKLRNATIFLPVVPA